MDHYILLVFKKIYCTRYGLQHTPSFMWRPTDRPTDRKTTEKKNIETVLKLIYTSTHQTDTTFEYEATANNNNNHKFRGIFVDVFLFIHFRSSFFVPRSSFLIWVRSFVYFYIKTKWMFCFFIISIELDCAHTFWMIGSKGIDAMAKWIMKQTTKDE